MTKYQFQVDGRGFGAPLRDTWREASEDAVNAGYAFRRDDNTYQFEAGQGATVVKVEPQAPVLPGAVVHDIPLDLYANLQQRIYRLDNRLSWHTFVIGALIAIVLWLWWRTST